MNKDDETAASNRMHRDWYLEDFSELAEVVLRMSSHSVNHWCLWS